MTHWWRLASGLLVSVLLLGCNPERPSGADQAQTLYGYCAPCHGEAGQGNPAYRAPAIAGLSQWYVEAQIEKFRNGARGAHPDDVEGLRMRPMSRTLEEDEVAVIAEYVASLPVANPAPTLEGGDPARGEPLYATCVECHGETGAGNQEKGAPELVHASDWYLVAQLQKFKEGVRGTNARDERGAQMRPMALGLADEQAMRDVVAYIGTLPD